MSNLFRLNHGVIVACDVDTIGEFTNIIKKTCSVKGIVGYKIGCSLALSYGLPILSDVVRNLTDIPIIYDHQKASTDIPQLGEKFAEACKKGGIQGVIIFPQAGPFTEEAFIDALFAKKLTTIVGGEMTHPGYLVKDGGFIRDDAPREMYKIAAKKGVRYFVLPGNKPEIIQEYHNFIRTLTKTPEYCMPGIGTQGGDIERAFKAIDNAKAYAIIGSAIYGAKDIKKAAEEFCRVALKFG